MHAIVHDVYGPPEVLRLEDRPRPVPAEDELLIEVHATSVTTAETRFRAAWFPPGMGVLGRLFVGWSRPRNRLTGRDFAGRIVAVGSAVTEFEVGQDVFGACEGGSNAQWIAVPETGSIAALPEGLSFAEGAALPFGAVAALSFVRDRAWVCAGERVLVVGASGGVGVYAVQVARALGAEVTAVCSGRNEALVRELGADRVVDYRETELTELSERFDAIVDVTGKTAYATHRHLLAPRGRYAFVEGGVWELVLAAWTSLGFGPRVLGGVAIDSSAALRAVAEAVQSGSIRPVVGDRFPYTSVVEAHRIVDARHRRGAVILEFGATP